MSSQASKSQLEDGSEITAIPLMQLVSGVYASKTLAAAVELRLFTKVAEKGTTFEEAAELLELEPRPAEMLVTGCSSLGLLQLRDGRFYNSPVADKYLVEGKREYFGTMVAMADRRAYEPWLRVTEALKTNRALTWGEHAGLFEALSSSVGDQRMFTEAMHALSVQSGAALSESVDLSGRRRLLDVGGGSGAYCIEAARRFPDLCAVVFDVPSALEVARRKIAEAGLTDRIETHPGNFFQDELPKGWDFILLSMILHDWTPDKNAGILRKCFDALVPGGEIIISELMMDDDKTGPPAAALMSLTMLIETEGRNYSWAEYRSSRRERTAS